MARIKKIAIIGGAGPMAGVLLFEQIIKICQSQYHCHRDSDFPFIQLINYPFSEMLEGNIDRNKIENELNDLANSLDATYITIACNTLHAFINQKFPLEKCVHLLETTKEGLTEPPLVICSRTSREAKIHQRFFSCHYPSNEIQNTLDNLINQILSGSLSQNHTDLLTRTLMNSSELGSKKIVLGCTEFSLLHHHFPIQNYEVIDPSLLVAKKLCQLYFQ